MEQDAEFRCVMAGYSGLPEVLKRLDSAEDGLRKLLEESRRKAGWR